MDPTAKAEAQSSACPEGCIVDPDGQWVFEYDASQVPLRSSGRKTVYTGEFLERGLANKRPCRALAFNPACSGDYGKECAALGMLSALGVGPKLLATTSAPLRAGAAPANIIFEEDAGTMLAGILAGQDGTAAQNALLHAPGTPEREEENAKIFVDVFTQLGNAHDAGVFHRDLRCENVCIRRFGPAPADIQATIIDFELGAGIRAGAPAARAPLFDILFHRIPSRLAGCDFSIVPTALELDMGYLAALSYHLVKGKLLLSKSGISDPIVDDFLEYLRSDVTFFGYPPFISPVFCRRIERERDIAPLAQRLNLTPVSSDSFPEEALLAEAMSFRKPFLDARDRSLIAESPAGKLHAMVQELAKAVFETYKERRMSQGLPIEYETRDEQPKDLRDSNYAQVAHIPRKVEALGYVIVPLDECPEELRINSFSAAQIEALAQVEHSRWMEERLARGWTCGERNPEAKTTPYLVPYDELEEDIKEYDRDAVKQVLPLLERAGFAVARPGKERFPYRSSNPRYGGIHDLR